MFAGTPKRIHLQPVVDRIIAKCSDWIGHSVSMAGRVCLVKSVIMSSLVYSMMVYKWQVSLMRKLEAAMRNFIWSGDIMKKGSVTVSWIRCCTPVEGGLNLRSIQSMNEAFLIRLAWDIHCNNVPFADLFRRRFLKSHGCPKSSYFKSSIWPGLKSHLSVFNLLR